MQGLVLRCARHESESRPYIDLALEDVVPSSLQTG
jgi:hypothetical protein